MEPYVAEEVAREMLAKDAALKVRFEEKLRDDPEFAASPRARLDFFYRLHPSWDERFNLYPVLRTAVVPGGRSEEHTSELQSLMRISYAVFCLKKKQNRKTVICKRHKAYT